MTQRAFAKITAIIISGNRLSADYTVNYSNENPVDEVTANQNVVMADLLASPRNIMSAVSANIIALQPPGYNLAKHNIILTGLERG